MNRRRIPGKAANPQRRSDELAFHRARLHLTAWYVLTLAAIVLAFSIGLYAALAAQLAQHQQEGPDAMPDRQVERDTTDFALGQLRLLLLVGNIVFLAGAGGGAYFLAGKTLRPIAVALERQRRFTADASHELRTPLTVMRGNVDVTLQRARTAAEYREVLRDLGAEIDGMTRLSEQLLRLARGVPEPAMSACDLRAILEGVVESSADLAAARGSALKLLPGPALISMANADGLRQVFLNLVLNAIQHTPPGSAIAIGGARRERFIEVEVSDNGLGIPTEERENVFQEFYRREPAETDGAGLGLALVRELVNVSGGSIAVGETPGGGATFSVRLPVTGSEA
ncbi:MAG: sensor histidine kinase [Dehalococcoidia bacterium]